MGWFGAVRGHSRSVEIVPFDTAHTSFYWHSIETMSLSCTVSEIQRDTEWKTADLKVPYRCLVPPCWNFEEIFGIRKLESMGYCTALFV